VVAWSRGWRGGWHAECDGCCAGGEFVELSEFVACSGEADLQAVDLAEPAFTLGFADAGAEVVAELDEAGALSRVGS